MAKQPSLRRRGFLKTVVMGAMAPATMSAVVPATDAELCVSLASGEQSDVARTITADSSSSGSRQEKVGEITGSGEPVGIEGEYVSDVYLAESSRFDYQFWRGVATIGPHSEDRGRIWLSEDFLTETARLLAHERGHNLGFRHTGGFMLPSNPDIDPDSKLAKESVTTTNCTDGLHLCDWRSETATDSLRQVIDDWRAGNISTADLRYLIGRWRAGDSRDLYANGTFATGLNLAVYDDQRRQIKDEAVYRPEHTARFDSWEVVQGCQECSQ